MQNDDYVTLHPTAALSKQCLPTLIPVSVHLYQVSCTSLQVYHTSVSLLVCSMSALFSFHYIRHPTAWRETSDKVQSDLSALSNMIRSDRADGPLQGRHVKYDLAVMLQRT